MRRVLSIILLAALSCAVCTAAPKKSKKQQEPAPAMGERWSEERANAWYDAQEWPVGCVFVPSYGGTPVEMWSAETFDADVVDRELGLAESLGFNVIRLFLCDIVWQNDHDGFMERLERHLQLCEKHGMRMLVTFFTNGGTIKNPYLGPQPQPKPGIHNSTWMSSPGRDVVNNPEKWGVIEKYQKEIMTKYRDDPRVFAWCLYNEPENTATFNTMPFLREVFKWAREVNPSQPLTAPVWRYPGIDAGTDMPIVSFILENSDVISFHSYADLNVTTKFVNMLLKFNRPLVCSEWMARTKGSTYLSILPLFKKHKVACFSYGLVNGKQQCHLPWNAKDKDGNVIPFTEEPPVWFHDIFRPDGTPWDAAECAFIRSMTRDIRKTPVAVRENYGTLSTGEAASKFTLVNSKGAKLVVSDYGARIISIVMPDRKAVMGDVVVGPDEFSTFENAKPERFLGCVIGRYGNRINHASFTLDGVKYELEANENLGGEPVQCHGASQGFDRFLWDASIVKEEGRQGVRMHRLSPDGESGFPGNCDCFVTYWLTEDNIVEVDYDATTDKPTVVNLSNHTFFNLKGDKGGYVMDHLFTVEADKCIQNNEQMCPDLILPVEGSPFDFREPHRVDYRLDMPNEQLRIMKGMSACWCIRGYDGTLRKAADLYDRESGRGVETWTTEPALLTYTARGFNGTLQGKYGPVEKYGGMLLETIHYADSPNQDRFPSTVLRPGEKYHSTTQWHFYAK